MNVVDFLGLSIKTSKIKPAEGSAASADEAAMLYFKAAATETAIGYVANAIASCEMRVMERGQPKRGQLYRLLNVRPNPDQSAAQMWSKVIWKTMFDGESLVVPLYDSLYPADTFTKNEVSIGRTRFENVYVGKFQVLKKYWADEAIYLTFGNQNARRLIDGMYAQYAKMMDAAVSGFRNAAGTKWKLDTGMGAVGDREFGKREEEKRSDPRDALRKFMSASNSVFFQQRGQTLEKFDIKGCASDDLIKIRKDAFELVASIFRIPPPLLFGNMTNLDEIMGTFLTFTVKPLAEQMSQEQTAKLIDRLDWLKGSEIVVDSSRVKHVDIFGAASSIQQLIGAAYSIDEIREWLNQPKLNTEESQKHLITRNFGPIEEVLRQIIQEGGEK